ncbi:putative acyl-CoA dehydrogenase [Novipirellula galeiformis]|uniref:Putative acyl-CoA dehydrogenase n=1 Tax=Novipirellula galeiformis TaxID=2528004 RepID=A0A5C6CM03_9BACT|nr:acyl-CoA dehydrogenase family protein [Novipirellula galeiformis]TWU25382.1 putative acyl-CoA dehydrogenase [Novipirellula galeiformis]
MGLVDSTSHADRMEQREQQIRQAEELLGSLPQASGVAKGMFAGRFVDDWVFPYPDLTGIERAEVEAAVVALSHFCDEHLDPTRIDREADIPRDVIDGLAELGLLGMTAPAEFGGSGFSQMGYCRLLEVIGGRCSSTSIFVNAHHSIGMRGLLLFGSESQKKKWLPDLVRGKKLAAFALTEPEAGSDASNVQTMAIPSADGSHFVLHGQKRYITNGAIADVLTVMARTPIEDSRETAITAFLVTPDMPGFQVTEPRMEKLGIRGTATARLAFDNLHVPRENILGPIGKGLKVALTVLDFGRTTFGACCTGAAKTCLRLATDHARSRRQFGRPLAEFELVQEKLARMSAWTYAMEATTNVTAGLIDRGLEDYMLETAMLKVWSTERLWTIVNDAFQIFGGAAYFTDLPLERMLRDHRINQIGEGANEVLMSFIALTGMRGPGMRMKEVSEAWRHPWAGVGTVGHFTSDTLRMRFRSPAVPVRAPELRSDARRLGKAIRRLGTTVQWTLVRHREEVLERQLVLQRIAWIAMELYATACTLSRWDHELADNNHTHDAVARLFVADSLRHVDACFQGMRDNHDPLLLAAASPQDVPS